MSQFDYDEWIASPSFPSATANARAPPSLALPALPLEPDSESGTYVDHTLDVRAFSKLCEDAARMADEPVLQLDGLLPIKDLLIDAPIGVAEFGSEKLRFKSGRPRWISLLQASQLKKLEAACPGAKTLIMQRKACCGYFLAE